MNNEKTRLSLCAAAFVLILFGVFNEFVSDDEIIAFMDRFEHILVHLDIDVLDAALSISMKKNVSLFLVHKRLSELKSQFEKNKANTNKTGCM